MEKLQKVGPNVLSERKQTPMIIVFLLQFTGLFNYVMWVGSILCFLSFAVQSDKRDKSTLYLGIVIFLVIMVSSILNYIQQSKTAAIMA